MIVIPSVPLIPMSDDLVMVKLRQLHESKQISDNDYALCLLSPDEARRIVDRELCRIWNELTERFNPSRLGVWPMRASVKPRSTRK